MKKPTLLKVEWANGNGIRNDDHLVLVQRFAAYHCLCPLSFKLISNPENGEIVEQHKNSALAWSRIFEWPWAILNAELQSFHKALDAGGGHAIFQYVLANHCQEVVNIDHNEENLRGVPFVQQMHNTGLNITTRVGDLGNIPYPDDYFDRVFCISVAEHIPHWRECIDELFRVTVPNGLVILTMDVNLTPSPEREFVIGGSDVSKLVKELGGELPPGSKDVFACKMPDGSVLSVLCLKILVGEG